MLEHIKSTLAELKQIKPLVLCLTNYVTMDFMANSLLALGAAPLMSEANSEIEELVHLSHVVYINIGTLNDAFLERSLLAATIANSLNKPVILDPVGAGASQLRTHAALKLLPFADVVRGNASEIISLNGSSATTKGVETSEPVLKAISSATNLAQELQKIIIISGPEDFVTDGKKEKKLPFGSTLMPLVTGMGCTMTAVLSAFIATNPHHFTAAVQATAYFGLCGQLTEQKTKTPGTFRQLFIDHLFQPDWGFFANIAEGVNHAI